MSRDTERDALYSLNLEARRDKATGVDEYHLQGNGREYSQSDLARAGFVVREFVTRHGKRVALFTSHGKRLTSWARVPE